jgi:hypothetical protein
MSNRCCGSAPSVYIDGKWSCSDCGSITKEYDGQLDFSHVLKDFDEPYNRGPKCECGADKVYGPNSGLHSATMPCPLYKKL